MPQQPIAGLIFDLDGTLVDSRLDFERMRQEIGLPKGQPILEAIERMPEDRARRCHAILDQHELAGAERARLMPGVAQLLAKLSARALPLGLVTRNSRAATKRTLDRLGLHLDTVLAREDAPAKPDPTAIRMICDSWEIAPSRVVVIGDYRFDLEAGKRAGAWTVLYTRGRAVQELPFEADPHLVMHDFRDLTPLLAWLDAPA